jgi:hypothetical protein
LVLDNKMTRILMGGGVEGTSKITTVEVVQSDCWLKPRRRQRSAACGGGKPGNIAVGGGCCGVREAWPSQGLSWSGYSLCAACRVLLYSFSCTCNFFPGPLSKFATSWWQDCSRRIYFLPGSICKFSMIGKRRCPVVVSFDTCERLGAEGGRAG